MLPEFPIEAPVFEFTILVMAALVVQLAFRRLPVPALVGLLIAGMLLGPAAANILRDDMVIQLLGSIGLLYIMFLAGLEIDLDIVNRHRREAASFGVLALGLTFLPAVGLGRLLGLDWAGAALLAAAISSHTLIAYPMVESMALLHRRPVVAAIGGTLVTDTVALLVLIVALQLAGAKHGGFGWAAPIAAFAVISAISLWLVPKASRYVFDVVKMSQAENALYVVGVLVSLAGLAAIVGAEDILGAFLAGLCLNRVLQGRKALTEHLVFAGRMLFIPFFFMETGMSLRLEAFTQTGLWLTAALILGVIAAGKSMAAWAAGWMFGYGVLDRLVMIGLTTPQAAATLAVSTKAAAAGLMSEELVDAIIIVIFVTCLFGALVTRYAGGRIPGARQVGNVGTEKI
jgi:Kef-type K+ transport system membrane component KefB